MKQIICEPVLRKWEKILVIVLVLIQTIIEILGAIYSKMPQVVFSFADAIIILIPLLFGVGPALLCLIPVAVAEIAWSLHLHAIGPFLHLVAFTLTAVPLGLAGRKLRSAPKLKRVLITGTLYEVALIGEEVVYRFFFLLFKNRPITWESISGTFLSPANPLLLILLVICCMIDAEPVETERNPN